MGSRARGNQAELLEALQCKLWPFPERCTPPAWRQPSAIGKQRSKGVSLDPGRCIFRTQRRRDVEVKGQFVKLMERGEERERGRGKEREEVRRGREGGRKREGEKERGRKRHARRYRERERKRRKTLRIHVLFLHPFALEIEWSETIL